MTANAIDEPIRIGPLELPGRVFKSATTETLVVLVEGIGRVTGGDGEAFYCFHERTVRRSRLARDALTDARLLSSRSSGV